MKMQEKNSEKKFHILIDEIWKKRIKINKIKTEISVVKFDVFFK